MKPYAPLISALLLCALLPGCSTGKAQPTASPGPAASPPAVTASAAPAPSTPPVSTPYTKEDALAAFDAYHRANALEGVTAMECVLTDDASNGLAAVVLFTDDKQNVSCNLAYVYPDGDCTMVGFATNAQDEVRDFEPESGTLAYAGDGKVTVDVQEAATGLRYRFSVTGVRGDAGTDFTVESEILE